MRTSPSIWGARMPSGPRIPGGPSARNTSTRRTESEGLTDVPLTVKTQRVPLGAKFFHPSGFGAGVTATYVNQDGQFIDGTTGSSAFWIVDAALSYRLPNRYGFIVGRRQQPHRQAFQLLRHGRAQPDAAAEPNGLRPSHAGAAVTGSVRSTRSGPCARSRS